MTGRIAIIGAPLDLGQERRGVDMGPSAIRYAGLRGRLEEIGRAVVDLGNIRTPEVESIEAGESSARFLPEILAVCSDLAALVAGAVERGDCPLVLGGDHSVAIGTLAGLARAAGARGGLIWLDAHGDLNTPATSPTGNVHGMGLAAAVGRAVFPHPGLRLPAVDPARLVLLGIRSLDPDEQRYLREGGITVFTMSEIDRIGIEAAMKDALARVAGPGFVHLSLDLDVLDPEIAPGVGTPVRGGLTYREAHLACELAAASGLVGSFEVVEANPILDRGNTTAQTAVELVASLSGKTIL